MTKNLAYKVLSQSPLFILIANKDKKLIYSNPSFRKFTGYKALDIINRNFRTIVSKETPTLIYKKIWNILKKNGQIITEEIFIKTKEQKPAPPVKSYLFTLKIDNENFYVVFQEDISQEKEKENKRNEFVYTCVHELKNTMTSLKLLVNSLEHKVKKEKKMRLTFSLFSLINNEIRKLSRLSEDVIDSSRIFLDKLVINLESVDLQEMLLENYKKANYTDKNHEYSILPIPKLKVICDPLRIQQIITNLISNARKFSAKETQIEIGARKSRNYAVIWVKDQGVGIPQENLSGLFKKFFRLDKKKRGLGLGLYLSQEIVKQHRGKIWAKSKLGKGSTFYFSLPISKTV